LNAELKLDKSLDEVSLSTKVSSFELIEVTIPDAMPAAVRLLVRACSSYEQGCDVAKASPVAFDVVFAP
jgi:hypothetical protein